MTNIELTQTEANSLIAMPKAAEHSNPIYLPGKGEKACAPLLGASNAKEKFFLNIYCGRCSLAKITNLLRARRSVVLVRLDLGGRPHRNPDGNKVGSNHIHLYKEGFQARWAYDLPHGRFLNTGDLMQTLNDFMAYCQVSNPPNFQWRQP